MTLRTRRPQGGIRTRLARLTETEERQQTLVTALFIGAIALVLLILVGAFLLSWYNDNLRPLARVGSVEVQPQQVRDYLNLEQFRIARDEARLTQAQIDGVIECGLGPDVGRHDQQHVRHCRLSTGRRRAAASSSAPAG